ncbi:hypothetical protein F8568_044055 [Actinomadura sp. LD22]|uniref:Uncharacterized protein n=1 Tax=Actinomadura physcomitrii TaxID=2650748 RepID=A0A6I4MLX5_9ACTN|nr:hypothetical protein [Actinomadura physcomitrii]MWA07198.1 hypothetical protein [Actinomadura physcomitrii]
MTNRSGAMAGGSGRGVAAAVLGGVLAAGSLAACGSDPTQKSSGGDGVC